VVGILINVGFPPFMNFFGELLITIHIIPLGVLSVRFFGNFIVVAIYSFTLLSSVIQKKKIHFVGGGCLHIGEGGFRRGLVGNLHILPVLLLLNVFFFF
jgi:hypothetical protein